MARKKKPTKSDPSTWKQSDVSQTGWGEDTETVRAPSGVPLNLDPDSDCILKFIAKKDITDNLPEEKRRSKDERAIYLTFFDGLKVVSMSATYALSAVELREHNWYYFHNTGEIETDLNPMKDISIRFLGPDGLQIKCPKRISDSGSITLEDEAIAECNYTRLNYPLRP